MKKGLLLLAVGVTALSASAQRLTSTSPSKYLFAVDEYRPAPGQFVNTLPKYEAGDDNYLPWRRNVPMPSVVARMA